MLDPFVDGRGDPIGGGAIGFAPDREELPDDIAPAYGKILKAPPKPQTFEQRWSVWGAGYGGSNRTTGDTMFVGSHDLSARVAGGAAGLDYASRPARSWALRSPAAAPTGPCRRGSAGGRGTPSRPALTAPRQPVPPLSRPRSPSPITGGRTTARPLAAPTPRAAFTPRAMAQTGR